MAADDVELLDAGDGRRLERFGDRVVDRPAPGAWGSRRDPDAWRAPDLRFDEGRGRWDAPDARALDPWSVEIEGLRLELRPTASGQLGIFPEHRLALPWLVEALARQASSRAEGASGAGDEDREAATPFSAIQDRAAPNALHLFGYTGLVTLGLARAGASVTHVDAQRSVVAWARANAGLSGLGDAPIRWIVDDAVAFAEREARRGRRYDAIVLDPPAYGHANGRTWRLVDDLPRLLAACALVASADAVILLTAHSEAIAGDVLGRILVDTFPQRAAPEVRPLVLRAASRTSLDLGNGLLIG